MRKPVARPFSPTPASPDQAIPDRLASRGFDPFIVSWTRELEQRRRAVDRWRGVEAPGRQEEQGAE